MSNLAEETRYLLDASGSSAPPDSADATPSIRPDITVTRTYRNAIRVEDDYTTLEETISVPIDASAAEIKAAVALGWRVYEAQQAALVEQVAVIRSQGFQGQEGGAAFQHPRSTDKQRSFIARLGNDLGWDEAQVQALYRDVVHDPAALLDPATLTRDDASDLIDALKQALVRCNEAGHDHWRNSRAATAEEQDESQMPW